jgi:thiol-disulfide isomerase/thioredoxin
MRALVASLVVAAAHAAGIKEPTGSKVNVLNRDLFQRFITRNPLVLMEWYTAWCEHCQTMQPKYQMAAQTLHDMKKNGEIPVPVKFAKMDDGDEYNRQGTSRGTVHSSCRWAHSLPWPCRLSGRYGAPEHFNFTGYPTLMIFQNGSKTERYYGGHEVDDLVFWMAAVSKGLDPMEEEKRARPGLYRKKTTAVLDLSPETFNATIKRPASLGNNVVYVVEFYSDRCPFCIGLAPEVIVAAEELKKKGANVVIAGVNSRIYHEVSVENEVTGHPWVSAFYDGVKVEDMAGLGGASTVVNFGERIAATFFDAAKGAVPSLSPAEYDADGVLVLDPEAAAWAKDDAAKWAAIEAEKAKANAKTSAPVDDIAEKAVAVEVDPNARISMDDI